ncbi:hypothetical protein J7438_15420 [Thalassotalea sp. G20_0]|uniref:hypothetical protein n=1 Tax=Thalassotalea sp. G20_0 TaxID=2821093 RepID=UPI001ADA3082|nr:hypothetical protein [Thalassotalea sp. G20_0]MBO9495468.1 hypothetical protein [Thalassotalea sp. G20_0]
MNSEFPVQFNALSLASQLPDASEPFSPEARFGPRGVRQIPPAELDAHQLCQSKKEDTLQIGIDAEPDASSVLPVHLAVADLIRQHVELELANAPICPVFVVNGQDSYDSTRFCSSVRVKMREYGLSQDDIDNAMGLMRWKDSAVTGGIAKCFFVQSRKVNECLYELSKRDQVHIDTVFEALSYFYDGCFEDVPKWTPISFKCFEISEPLINERYTKPAEYAYVPYLKIEREKYIIDRTAEILTDTHNIFHKTIHSNRSDGEKVAYLRNMLGPAPSAVPVEKTSDASSTGSEQHGLSAQKILARIGEANSLNSKGSYHLRAGLPQAAKR